MRRTSDWLKQAEAALSQARDSARGGHYWASCFFSHQAAEFYVKALLISRGIEARGHSVHDLLEELTKTGLHVPESLLRVARSLDRHYLQSRYVNAFHTGAPVDYYRKEDAEKALREAEEVAEYCRREVQAS